YLAELRARGPAGWAATRAYVVQIAERGQPWEVRWFVWKYRNDLKKDDGTWGGIAHALLRVGPPSRLVAWTSDWASRNNASGAALLCAAVVRRRLNDAAGAHAINERALDRQHDSSRQMHEIWLALDDVIAGQPEAAVRRLERVSNSELTHYYLFLKQLVSAA